MEWAIEILKQVPALCILTWLVTKFLAHLTARDKVLKEISTACHDVQTASMNAVKDNTVAISAFAEVIRKCPDVDKSKTSPKTT